MARLDQLPSELVFLIAEDLPNEKNINAFVQTNRNLYSRLQLFLCQRNIKNHQTSPLPWAARNGYTNMTVMLLDAGANIAAFETPEETIGISRNPQNPLLFAAQGRHIVTLKTMLSETRSDRACSPAQRRTVLNWAIYSHDQELVELMIRYKAPLDPAGYGPFSALGAAVASGYDLIIPRLLKEGAQPGYWENPCPIANAIYTDQRQVVELLLKQGVRLVSDRALCDIVRRNDKDLYDILVKYNALEVDVFGPQALFMAIMHGNYEMVESLIEQGANPHLEWQVIYGAPGSSFYGTIGFAIYFHHFEIAKLLLAKGVLPSRGDFLLAEVRRPFPLSQFSYRDLPQKNNVFDYVRWQISERYKNGLGINVMEANYWSKDSFPESYVRDLL
ncbi:hypothetical protein N7471_002905 [Penicillium samsonianum]|uniref:uncharacterized protein n=1 Tax=Penicillium samsonianum TaxID=1882272 RepID=UPI0025474856|nr:uncharacterized protein N7471_002905 [Penicillium samsonianum]KAJ6143452.1 hypothetical protein N7471_002905 [Penicillium samsonianum]